MDRERFLELDRSGNGLTDEEYAQGFHWCYEWDQMLVGPGQPEALVCSCNHPKIEEWKQSDEAKQMLREQEERMNRKRRGWDCFKENSNETWSAEKHDAIARHIKDTVNEITENTRKAVPQKIELFKEDTNG